MFPVPPGRSPRILIVGVCASGKSTLAQGLQALGYDARSLAQEHSTTPRFWARRAPDVLIGLDCRYETTVARKQKRWSPERWAYQRRILQDALGHADFIIHTDGLTPAELVAAAVRRLQALGYPPGRPHAAAGGG